MVARIAINGFGRIGRMTLKAILERYPDQFQVVAINDLSDPCVLSHLFKYDSTYGIYPGEVKYTAGSITIAGREIAVSAIRDLPKLPWAAHQVDIVIESTGVVTDGLKARGHLEAGAKRVIITAPAKNEDATIVMGINEGDYRPDRHRIVSNASCTTNCLGVVAKVLHENFTIKRALMSTVHAYTNDQRILDQVHSDLRRARTAGVNIIPTTTGAAKAVCTVIPDLAGKFHGVAFRVPVVTVSLADLVADVEREATIESVNATFKDAAEGPLKGILGYTTEPLVSSDFIRNSNSATVDALSTMVIDKTMVKVVSWYDNEWGYCCRTADLANLMVTKGLQER
mgnify:CR=1 FL=1